MKFLFSTFLLFMTMSFFGRDGFKIINSDANSVTVEYTFSGYNKIPVTINNKTYQKIYAEGCVPVLNVGFPQLLRSSVSLAIPNNAVPKLEIVSMNFSEVSDISIAPSKGSLTRNINPEEVPYTFASAYTQNNFYPLQPVQVNSTYLLRGQKGISLSIFPVQANPVTNTLKVAQTIIFKISYITASGKKINFAPGSFTSNEEKQIMTNRFLNLAPALSAARVQYTPINEFGDLLIISDPALMTSIQPLADWKNQKGIKTYLVSSATSGTNYAQVQAYIQNYYATHPNLLYVLFVGDHEQINAYPAGMADSEVKWSDAYYGLLSGNDHYPELMVGRFSSALTSEITTMVNRTLEYEKNPAPGQWFTKGIGIGSNQGYGIGDEGEADWQHIRKIGNKLLADGYTFFQEFYDSTHAGTDAPGDPNSTMVSSAVNNGASVFLYCGHGAQNVCVTSNYSSTDIGLSTNNGMYPFSVQVACNNGTFNGGTCLSEVFTRASNVTGPTGAIASAGSSILMAWAEPMDTEDEIGDIISDQYPNNKKYTLGGLFYNAQMHMLDDYPTQTGEDLMETWILFGDPSCMFRCQSPVAITATHDPCIQSTASSFSLSSSFGVNTYACVSQNNQVIGTALISSGNTTIPFTQTFNTSQNLLLTITEYNKLPYIISLPVCAVTGINEIKTNNDFFVQSPVTEILNFNYTNNSASELKLTLVDLQGKLLATYLLDKVLQTEGDLKINVSFLSQGIYFLRVSDRANAILKTIKVVKE